MTSERPTPRELAGDSPASYSFDKARHNLLDDIEEAGYVIVHPDDVPYGPEPDPKKNGYSAMEDGDYAYEDGWNACRSHIFGGDQ